MSTQSLDSDIYNYGFILNSTALHEAAMSVLVTTTYGRWRGTTTVVAATTEEGYPQMLPHMTIGCGRVLIHHATTWAERYLLSLVVIIIDGHPGQAFCLVELVNHILPFILKWHIWGYYGYQWALSLGVEEWAQARYLFGDTGSGVQGQPFVFIFEGIGLALGQVTLAVEVVDPIQLEGEFRRLPAPVESQAKS